MNWVGLHLLVGVVSGVLIFLIQNVLNITHPTAIYMVGLLAGYMIASFREVLE